MIRSQQPLIALGIAALAATAWPQTTLADEEACGEYGTSVVFASSPAEAARQARKEEKLVFVLHVSGHFEESDYT